MRAALLVARQYKPDGRAVERIEYRYHLPAGITEKKILDQIFDRYVTEKLIEPTFVIDYPAVFSTLAKSRPDKPEIAERLVEVFEVVFSAEKLRISKRDSGSYLKVAGLMGKKPEEVVFVDDNLINVEAARSAGMQGIVYKGVEDFKANLMRILQQN